MVGRPGNEKGRKKDGGRKKRRWSKKGKHLETIALNVCHTNLRNVHA